MQTFKKLQKFSLSKSCLPAQPSHIPVCWEKQYARDSDPRTCGHSVLTATCPRTGQGPASGPGQTKKTLWPFWRWFLQICTILYAQDFNPKHAAIPWCHSCNPASAVTEETQSPGVLWDLNFVWNFKKSGHPQLTTHGPTSTVQWLPCMGQKFPNRSFGPGIRTVLDNANGPRNHFDDHSWAHEKVHCKKFCMQNYPQGGIVLLFKFPKNCLTSTFL